MTVETPSPANALFYVTGGTLPPDASSYVERAADRELLSSLQSGEYCYVLNSRQMGKSSLSVRTIARLRSAGIRTAFVDLTRIGAQNVTVDQWYAGLLAETGRALDLRGAFLSHWKDHQDLPPVQRYFGALREVALPALDAPLVLFVDEIDAVRSLGFSVDEFFAAVRACYNARTEDEAYYRMTFCLVGAATPADLISDTRMSPFNVGKRIELGDFTSEEAAPLSTGLGNNGQELLDRILYWTGGHPYLTQRLCRAVSENRLSSGRDSVAIDTLCRDLFLTHTAREIDDNLSFVRNRLLKSDVDIASLLDLYDRMRAGRRVPDDETNPLTGILKLSGVARVKGGLLTVRNRIYEHVFDRHWVVAHMPDAELRRQKHAYRRGMVRAGAVSSGILCVVAVLAVIAVRNGRYAQERELEMRRLLYASDMGAAQQALNSDLPKRAHSLLEAHIPPSGEEDLRTFEWRYLWHQSEDESLYTSPDQGSPVFSLAFSRDGRRLVTGFMNGGIKLWDASSRHMLATFTGHTDQMDVAFSPDGGTLATASRDGTLRLWDVASGREKEWPFKKYRPAAGPLVRFSPSGRLLLANDESNRTTLWDLVTRQKVWQLPGTSGCFAFSPDGRTLAAVNSGSITLWEVAAHRKLAERRLELNEWAKQPVYSEDGNTIAVIAIDKTIRLLSSDLTQVRAVLRGLTSWTMSVAFSPDGQTLASVSADGLLRLWDVASGQTRVTLRGHTNVAYGVAYSPDGKTLVTSGKDGTIRFWDPSARSEREEVRGKAISGALQPLQSLSPDGRTVAVTDGRGIRLRETTGLRETGLLPVSGDLVYPIGFSPDSRTLFVQSGSMAGGGTNSLYHSRVEWWDVSVQKVAGSLPPFDTADAIVGSLSRDGKWLAVLRQSSGSVGIWDVAARREVQRLPGHGLSWWLTFSPDGRSLLVSCTKDRSVHRWDTATWKEQPELGAFRDAPLALAMPQDGRLLAVSNYMNDVVIWNTRSWREPLVTFPAHQQAPKSLAFSPDGQTLATGGDDGVVRLWNVRTWRLTLTLTGHRAPVLWLAFDPDGTRLYSGDSGGTVRIWRAAPLSEIDSRRKAGS